MKVSAQVLASGAIKVRCVKSTRLLRGYAAVAAIHMSMLKKEFVIRKPDRSFDDRFSIRSSAQSRSFSMFLCHQNKTYQSTLHNFTHHSRSVALAPSRSICGAAPQPDRLHELRPSLRNGNRQAVSPLEEAQGQA